MPSTSPLSSKRRAVPLKRRQRLCRILHRHTYVVCRQQRAHRVQDIVSAWHLQLYRPDDFLRVWYPAIKRVVWAHAACIKLPRFDSIGKYAKIHETRPRAIQECACAIIIAASDQVTIVWQQIHELLERALHSLRRLEEIRVIPLDIRHDGDIRAQAEEHIVVLVRLDHEDIALANRRVRPGRAQHPADDVRGVFRPFRSEYA